MPYNTAKIRQLLNTIASEQELRVFCFDQAEFRPVYDDLKDSDRKSHILERLLAYAEQTGQIESILAWAQKLSPTHYEAHAPYDAADPANLDQVPAIHHFMQNYLPPQKAAALWQQMGGAMISLPSGGR